MIFLCNSCNLIKYYRKCWSVQKHARIKEVNLLLIQQQTLQFRALLIIIKAADILNGATTLRLLIHRIGAFLCLFSEDEVKTS